IEVIGHWDWDAVRQTSETVQEMASSVKYPLALLVLLPDDSSIPPSGFAQNSRLLANGHTASERHTIVYVIINPALKILWEQTISVVAADGSRYFVVAKEAEAQEIVASRAL